MSCACQVKDRDPSKPCPVCGGWCEPVATRAEHDAAMNGRLKEIRDKYLPEAPS